jgi:hypothetical protein
MNQNHLLMLLIGAIFYMIYRNNTLIENMTTYGLSSNKMARIIDRTPYQTNRHFPEDDKKYCNERYFQLSKGTSLSPSTQEFDPFGRTSPDGPLSKGGEHHYGVKPGARCDSRKEECAIANMPEGLLHNMPSKNLYPAQGSPDPLRKLDPLGYVSPFGPCKYKGPLGPLFGKVPHDEVRHVNNCKRFDE